MSRKQELASIKKALEVNALPLWQKWQDEIAEATKEDKEESMLSRQICVEQYGVDYDSQLALMFEAFCAGLDKGMDVVLKMNPEQINALRNSAVNPDPNEDEEDEEAEDEALQFGLIYTDENGEEKLYQE